MTPEEWKQFGEVLVTWGFWAIVYGAITMGIGFIIILFFNEQLNKVLHYICRDF